MKNRTIWWAAHALALSLACPAVAEDACRAVEIEPLAGDDQVYVSGINNRGQVVGFSYKDGATSGFVWHRGRSRPLEPLVAGGDAMPLAINDLGQVVGEAAKAGGVQPVLWGPSGISRLPGQPGDRPEAINAQGMIAGSRDGSCILWRSPRDEPIVLERSNNDSCSVSAINERGEVVGLVTAPSGQIQGFLWYDGTFYDVPAVELPGVPDRYPSSGLLAINEQGLAVGYTSPQLDLMTYRRGAVARRLTSGANISAVSVNDWSRIFAVRESDEHLLLMSGSGTTSDRGPLTGGVDGHHLFGNNLNQIAWQANGQKGYFCQLPWW